MKIGLYISSSCAKDPLAYAFANLLSEGLGNRVQTLTRHDKLDPTLDLVHILGGNDLYFYSNQLRIICCNLNTSDKNTTNLSIVFLSISICCAISMIQLGILFSNCG